MSAYALVKTLHILSATLLFGTGLGSAFYLWRADQSRDLAAIAFAARNVVIADWLFTLPAIVFQPLSGLWLVRYLDVSLGESWLLWTYGLYVLAGICWLPVVWLQIRLRDMATAALAQGEGLPRQYRRYMSIWFTLGWPAFTAVLVIFYLMVAKP
ncbi:MAG: DUF2269 domain-containing protein [Rhodospirillales bacterium]|nr:DUF2269 domain-containing protein [Rhodospirillales bacterium]